MKKPKYVDTISRYRYATRVDQASTIKRIAYLGIASPNKGHPKRGRVITNMITPAKRLLPRPGNALDHGQKRERAKVPRAVFGCPPQNRLHHHHHYDDEDQLLLLLD